MSNLNSNNPSLNSHATQARVGQSNDSQKLDDSYLIPLFNRQPVAFVRGEGVWLIDDTGERYLDALMGIAVCGLGHAHPAIAEALAEQAHSLLHTSNLYEIPWQQKAGQLLCEAAGMQQAFFANSGAESNEAALKLARLYAHKKGFKKPKVIVMDKSFHGRTLLTLSATGNQKVREGFYPLDGDFIRVPHGDVEAIKAAASQHDEICAVLLEPIQGEGGINLPSQGLAFLEEVEALCKQHDWLFMLDEIQTGNGRTGKYFAYQHTRVQPDVLTTAKGVANGFPVGACMVAGKAVGVFSAGNHGSTYGGTPMQCRAVCATYEVMAEQDVLENVAHTSTLMRDVFAERLSALGVTIKGMGLMIGLELPVENATHLVDTARTQHKLLINVTAGNVVRLLPALNMSESEAQEVADRACQLIMDELVS